VLVKEALANGRLAGEAAPPEVRRLAAALGTTPDAVALAAVLARDWAGVVLSGAASVAQLRANLAAADLALGEEQRASLTRLAEPPQEYWAHRAALPWG